MKSLIYIAAFVAFSLQSFGSTTNKTIHINNENSETTVSQNTPENGSPELITKAVFLKKVWDYEKYPEEWKFIGKKPVIIDFYADWCGPCRKAAPILEGISKDYAGKIIVYKIDTEKEKELASVFQIRGIPAFLYIPVNGKPVMMSGVGRSDEETKKMFEDNIEKILLGTE